MTWVKICGMTSRDAVEAAVVGGADAIGLVLAQGSSRTLTLDTATRLAHDVPIASFIVVVDLSPGEALAAAEYVGASGIQAHGKGSLDVAAEAVDAGYLSIVPVPVGPDGPRFDVGGIPGSSLPLFDTASADMHGGTGATFDWSLISDPGRPFILAGGLDSGNVAEAIRAIAPFGVDASSGLESEPGIKDPSRIVAFIERAKQI